MKKLLKTTLLLTVLSFAVTVANAQGKIVFEQTAHNFGSNIPEKGGNVTHRFMFTNTGNEPVKIENVQASCGCTTPGWSKELIAPGEQGYVDATYRPLGHQGSFTKSLTVKNTGDPKQIALTISGTVIKAPRTPEEEFPVALESVRLTEKAFAFARIPMGTKEERASVIKIYNSSEEPVEISFKNVPEYLRIDALPVRIEPKQRGEIKASFVSSKKVKYGTAIDELDLLVNGKPAQSLTSTLTVIPEATAADKGELRPVLKFINNNYTFSNIKQGTMIPNEFKFTNAGQADLQIIATNIVNDKSGNVKITCPNKPIKPGEEGVIKVVLTTKKLEGQQDFNIEILTNVAANPVSNIVLRGNIVK